MTIQNQQQYKFFYGTKNDLDRLIGLGLVNQNHLYYLTDKQQIYVGDKLYGSEFITVEEFPSEPKINTLYIKSNTKEVRIFDGLEYKTVCLPVSQNLDLDYGLATSKAIRDYIKNISDKSITGVKYRVESQSLNLQYGDGSIEDILLKDILTNVEYDSQTGDFIFSRANGEDVSINTPKENFLSDVSYDPYKNTITFKMVNGSTFDVDLTDLIEIYTAEDTQSIDMNLSGNRIFANLKLSNKEDNRAKLDENGLYVPDTDLSNYFTSNETISKIDEVYTPLQQEVDRLEIDKQNNLTAGVGIRIDNNVISSMFSNVEWGNIQGNILDQEDLQEQFSTLQSTIESNISTTEGQLQGKIDSLQQQTTKQIGDLNTNLSTQIQEVQVNLDNTQQELSKEISDTKTEIENTIQPKLDQLDRDLDTAQENLSKEISDTKAEIENTIQPQLDELNQDLDTIQQTLSKEISDTKTEIENTIQPKLDELDEEIDNTKTNIQNLENTKQNNLTSANAGDGISIVDGIISNTRVSAEWGNIKGNISTQNDLQLELESKVNLDDMVEIDMVEVDIDGIKTDIEQLEDAKLNKTSVDNATIHINNSDNLEVLGVKTLDGTSKKTWIGTSAKYETDRASGLITDTTECIITDDEQELTLGVDTYTKDEIDDKIKSSYYVGQTIFSLDPLNYASLRLLDGSLLQVGGVYDEFISKYIEPLFKKHPNRFISESEWQQQVSTYGVCGKYVYTEGVAVRLPKVTGIVEGTIDPSALGDLVEAGLPNINGELVSVCQFIGDDNPSTNGAIGTKKASTTRYVTTGNGTANRLAGFTFNAANSSSIYGKNSSVQPQTIKGYYYIVVATGIDEEVNLKFDTLDVDYARSDLSNLTHEGERHFVGKDNITNCLLEVPQRIKLELADGTLTLKAGSEVIVPNGFEADGTTPKFDYVTVESDSIRNVTNTSPVSVVMFYSSSNGNFSNWTVKDCYSGTTAPTATYAVWYDTSRNKIYSTTNGGTTWTDTKYSLPTCIATLSSTGFTSIDQIFNGFGYIGSTIWVDKGVKYLVSNGRNEDGSLKNIEVTTHKVSTSTITGTPTGTYSYVLGSNRNIYHGAGWYYDEANNYVRTANGAIALVLFQNPKLVLNAGKIESFEIKQPFRAIDYSDKSTVSSWSMPSSKYIDLTLGASGSTYTAPASGWFYIRKVAGATGNWLNMGVNPHYISCTAPSSNAELTVIYPVRKGYDVTVSYQATGATGLFRFIYAEGSRNEV